MKDGYRTMKLHEKIIALLCIVFIEKITVAVMIYGTGLIYSGGIRIIQAFRRTAVIYIQ